MNQRHLPLLNVRFWVAERYDTGVREIHYWLAIAVALIHRARRQTALAARWRELLTADGLYWIGMLLAGALGTAVGDRFAGRHMLGLPSARY